MTAGVIGGIPTNRTSLIDVTAAPYYADKTGAANAAPAIQSAINAAAAGQVVYLPAGTYRLDATLNINTAKDGITLRGAGVNATILDSRASTAIYAGSSSDYQWKSPVSGNVVTSARTKGTTTLSIPDTSAFSVGQIIHIKINDQQDNAAIQAGAVPVVNVSAYRENRSMKARVTGKTGSSLTFTPGLYFDCTGFTTTINGAQLQTDNVGVEDLTVEGKNGTVVFGVSFDQCYGSWIKNVKVNNAANYAFNLANSVNCEIRHSFANARKTAGSNGAGILFAGSSACLVEDNIVYKFFPLIETNFGATGNVFAYNLLEDSRVNGVIGAGIDTNHGPHNSFNLYEGNVTPSVQSDGYFGSASEDTIFRNWVHGTIQDGSQQGYVINLNRFTRYYSVVGNILGAPTTTAATPYAFGLPNMGNGASSGTTQPSTGSFWADWTKVKTAAPGAGPGSGGFQERDLDVQATTVLKGNYHYITKTVPAGESLGGDALPDSLYLSGKPAWFGNLTWPAFGPNSATPSYASIPAGYRFIYGVDPDGQSTPQPPVATAPAITQQPQSQTLTAGTTATFSANASGSPAPSFQWRKDGVAINGATGTTLTIANVQSANAGSYTVVASNSAGSATSSAATLVVSAGSTSPVFTTQPSSLSVTTGGTATFTSAATCSPSASYQWRKDGVAISGATGATLTVTNVQPANAGNYTVVASNSMGSATSNTATLSLSAGLSAPVITTQPSSQTAAAGSSVTLTIAATGNPAPTYQWRKNGADIAGAKSASYTIPSVTSANAGTYMVVVLNSMGMLMSNNAVLTVAQATTAPAITTQPTSRTVDVGASTTFTVAASGNPAPTYQWRKNGTAIAGATGASYTIASAATGDAATYTVVATNSVGSATSNGAVLTVNIPQKAPTFTTQPTSRTTTVGTSTTFTAAADGTPAPSYQWRKNGTAIAGATSASYTIANAALADAATYSVVATNPKGSATSNNAVLTVNPAPAAPVFTTQPASAAIATGVSVTFTAAATGYPTPTYQWRKNGADIAGATGATYSIASATTADAATYVVVATNSTGATTSNGATLTVSPTPTTKLVHADFNGDGKSDLYWQNVETGETTVWLLNGTSYAGGTSLPNVSLDWKVVGHGDFNRDGKTDLLWQNLVRGEYGVLFMNGTTAGASVTLGSTASGRCLNAGDFNADDNADILWQNNATGEITARLMSGTSQIAVASVATPSSGWVVAGVGDFTGDGKDDILLENAPVKVLGLWSLNGTTVSGWTQLGATRPGMCVAGTGDFNDDGKTDILWQDTTTGLREVSLMSGTTVSSVVVIGYVDASWQIRN